LRVDNEFFIWRGLDSGYTLADGEHAKRKFRSRSTLEGETDGHKDARAIPGGRCVPGSF
jgi:hypothetical protein